MMGPLSFSLPPSHSCVLRGHPQLKVVGIIRTESMRATLPEKKREMQDRLACTFLMGNSSNLHSYSWPWRMNQTSKPQWPVPFGHRVKRCLFSTELTCFPLPTFSRRVASMASLACSPGKDDTLHTEESGPNCSPAPLEAGLQRCLVSRCHQYSPTPSLGLFTFTLQFSSLKAFFLCAINTSLCSSFHS